MKAADAISSPQIVLEIGAEGGSITVLTRVGDGGVAEYSVRLRDQSLTLLQGDEIDNEIRRDTAWTHSWDQAIVALGRWPWPMLVPLKIHPYYAERMLVAVKNYRGRDGRPATERGMERWAAACRGSGGK